MVAGDRPATLEPQADFPTNLGGLCSKGWNATSLLDHPERLLTPLVRTIRGDRTSPLRPATWDEALGQVVDAIRAAQRDHGLDAVGCFGGGGLTNEKAYAFGKFARVALRTAMIDYNGRFCMSSAATASNRAFGIDRGLPFPLADIAEAQAVLLVGSNPADTMPPAMQFFDAGRAEGAKHIVVDPRRTATAAGASLHLQPVPGTDLALANGMLHLAVREGWVDTAIPRPPHDGVRVGARRCLGLLARPGRADHRGAGRRPLPRHRVAGPGPLGHDPHRARRRAAQPRHRHRAGLHQPRPRARPARTAGLRLRHDHRPGQRPGRPRARPEGRPAARLPQAGRPR